MPKLVPLTLPPGVVRPGTAFKAKGRWYDAHLVRWHEGAMRPVGGWTLLGQGAGPSGPPTSPGATTNSSTQFTATWSNGDVTAETEVWVQNVTDSGAYFLAGTAAAAATSLPVTGLDAYHEYNVKMRHKKNSKFSAYTTEADGFTQLAAPEFYGFGSDATDKLTIRVKQTNDHAVHGATDIEIDRGSLTSATDDFPSGNSVTTEGGTVELTAVPAAAADGLYNMRMYVSVTIDENPTDFSTIKLTVSIEADLGAGFVEYAEITNTFQTSNISGPPPFETNTATWDPWSEVVSIPGLQSGDKIRLKAKSVTFIGDGATGSFILRGGDGAGANPESYSGALYTVPDVYTLLKTVVGVNLGVMSPDETDSTASCAASYALRARAKKTGWGGGTFSAYTEDEDGDNVNSACQGETDAGLF
jgi:hypothetical protein